MVKRLFFRFFIPAVASIVLGLIFLRLSYVSKKDELVRKGAVVEQKIQSSHYSQAYIVAQSIDKDSELFSSYYKSQILIAKNLSNRLNNIGYENAYQELSISKSRNPLLPNDAFTEIYLVKAYLALKLKRYNAAKRALVKYCALVSAYKRNFNTCMDPSNSSFPMGFKFSALKLYEISALRIHFGKDKAGGMYFLAVGLRYFNKNDSLGIIKGLLNGNHITQNMFSKYCSDGLYSTNDTCVNYSAE